MRIRLSLLCFVAAVAAGSLPRRTAAGDLTPTTTESVHVSKAKPLSEPFSFIPNCALDCVRNQQPLLWTDPRAACKVTAVQNVKNQIDRCVHKYCPIKQTPSFFANLRGACVFPSTATSSKTGSRGVGSRRHSSTTSPGHHRPPSSSTTSSHPSTSSTTSPTKGAAVAAPSSIAKKEPMHRKTLSGGVLAAVIIIPIAFFLLVGAVIWLVRRRYIKNRSQSRSMPFDHPPPQGPVPSPSNTGWTALDSHHTSYASDGNWGMPDEDRIPSRAMSNVPSDYHHLENDPPPHNSGDIRSNYANNHSFLRPPTPASPDLGYVGTPAGPGNVGTPPPLGPGSVGTQPDLSYVKMSRDPSSSYVTSPVSPMSSFRAGGSSSMRHASISTIDSVAPPRPPAPGEEPIGIARADSVSWRREIEHAAERAALRVVASEQERAVKDKSKSTRNVGETGREEWPLFGRGRERGSWGSRKSAANAER